VTKIVTVTKAINSPHSNLLENGLKESRRATASVNFHNRASVGKFLSLPRPSQFMFFGRPLHAFPVGPALEVFQLFDFGEENTGKASGRQDQLHAKRLDKSPSLGSASHHSTRMKLAAIHVRSVGSTATLSGYSRRSSPFNTATRADGSDRRTA
jgi:hypothetical protein